MVVKVMRRRFIALACAALGCIALLSLPLLTANPASGSSLTSAIVAEASSQNYGYGPCGANGENDGYYATGTDQSSSCNGSGGETHAWCADFAGWVWQQAGAEDMDTNLNNLADSFYYWGEAHGTLSTTPAVGDVVFYHPDAYSLSTTGYDHVAIITYVNSNGTFDEIGGNEGSGNVQEDTDMPGTVGSFVWDDYDSNGNPVAVDVYAFIAPIGGQASTYAADPAGPVVWDPESSPGTGQMQVYTAGATGGLDEAAYNSGWSWSNISGDTITGIPSAVWDPDAYGTTGQLQVYVNVNGSLDEAYYTSSGWTVTSDLLPAGDTVTGSPSAVWDPDAAAGAGQMQVYVNVNGGLDEAYYTSSGWTVTSTLPAGDTITGSPVAVWDPDAAGGAGQMQVYANSSSGLVEVWFGSTWTLTKIGGSFTGTPGVIWDPDAYNGTGQMQVYVTGGGGELWEAAYGSGGWTWTGIPGDTIAGSPSPVWDPDASADSGQIQIYATDAGTGSLDEAYFAGSSWQWYTVTGGPSITGSPLAYYDQQANQMQIYATSAGTGNLYEAYFTSQWNWANALGDIAPL
jgi:hypothetical protein